MLSEAAAFAASQVAGRSTLRVVMYSGGGAPETNAGSSLLILKRLAIDSRFDWTDEANPRTFQRH
jgi:hypothetical protein